MNDGLLEYNLRQAPSAFGVRSCTSYTPFETRIETLSYLQVLRGFVPFSAGPRGEQTLPSVSIAIRFFFFFRMHALGEFLHCAGRSARRHEYAHVPRRCDKYFRKLSTHETPGLPGSALFPILSPRGRERTSAGVVPGLFRDLTLSSTLSWRETQPRWLAHPCRFQVSFGGFVDGDEIRLLLNLFRPLHALFALVSRKRSISALSFSLLLNGEGKNIPLLMEVSSGQK